MTFYTKLVGVTFQNEESGENRQYIIRTLYRHGELEEGTELIMRMDPENKFDDHAVAVFAPDGRQIGHLPKQQAYQIFENMKRGVKYKMYVSCVTGGEAGNAYGVNVKIEQQ